MTAQKEKAIELKNVGVTYQSRKSLFKREKYQALKDISFDVYKGETLGIIGRNGAGKSTLLRLLAGIIKPDSGEVLHHCKSVSLMALAAGFDPNLSGQQNALISGMLIGHSKKEMSNKLDAIKEFSELNDFFDKPVKNYSSGMKARLSFATAMNTNPDVLLIDEVLAVGDVHFKEKAETAITEKINSNITVILVSHSEAQMKRLGDRVVWVDEGLVREEGALDNVFFEYNLNMRFAALGLKLATYIAPKDFIINLEPIKIIGDRLAFNCIVLHKLDRAIESVWCSSKTNCTDKTMLSGPKLTLGYQKIYPNLGQAKHARYENGGCEVGTECELQIKTNNCVDVVVFKVESF